MSAAVISVRILVRLNVIGWSRVLFSPPTSRQVRNGPSISRDYRFSGNFSMFSEIGRTKIYRDTSMPTTDIYIYIYIYTPRFIQIKDATRTVGMFRIFESLNILEKFELMSANLGNLAISR